MICNVVIISAVPQRDSVIQKPAVLTTVVACRPGTGRGRRQGICDKSQTQRWFNLKEKGAWQTPRHGSKPEGSSGGGAGVMVSTATSHLGGKLMAGGLTHLPASRCQATCSGALQCCHTGAESCSYYSSQADCQEPKVREGAAVCTCG